MSSSDKESENTAYISTKGSSALEGVGTNPTGKQLDENTAHVDPHKGSTALDGVGAIPDNKQDNTEQSQPQPKNTVEYINSAYTSIKDKILGSTQKSNDKK